MEKVGSLDSKFGSKHSHSFGLEMPCQMTWGLGSLATVCFDVLPPSLNI